MNLCLAQTSKAISFFTGTVSEICFPFSSIEFIHEKEGKETDGSTDRREFSSTMLVLKLAYGYKTNLF